MWLPIGPGPVLVYEWRTATWRWRLYALRAGFCAVIVAGMSLTWPSLWKRHPDQIILVSKIRISFLINPEIRYLAI